MDVYQNVQSDGGFSDGSLSGITRSGGGKFPNPFFDIASEYIPRDLNQIFEWAEYLYLSNGTFKEVSRRVVRYFLTELVLDGIGDKEEQSYKDFLNDDLHIMQKLATVGDNYMVYGNVFLTVYFPFDRYLVCPECHTRYLSKKVPYDFTVKSLTFTLHCPKCDKLVRARREDLRSDDTTRTRAICWNPKNILMRPHPISGNIEYYIKLEADFVKKIREGNKFYLEDTNWPIIEACATSEDNVVLKLSKNDVYHLAEQPLAGLPVKGWGIPPILANFKLAYYIQLMRRYDEAFALDYIVPYRIMYPAVNMGSAGDDLLNTTAMNNFTRHLSRLVHNKRMNPTDMNFAPFPIGYEAMGGEAGHLSPKESISMALEEWLNASGFPADLYKGDLQLTAFPVALRLFENSWSTLVDSFNDILQWMVSRISRYYGWDEPSARLLSVSLADDIERKALALQAAAGQDISKATAYQPLGIDYMNEQKRVMDEQKELMRLQEEAERDIAAEQLGGGGPEGGGGGGAPMGIDDIHGEARAIAEQMVVQVPETLRRGELQKIKASNPTLHALVMQYMDELRRELARQGQAIMTEEAKMASAEQPSPFALGLFLTSQLLECDHDYMKKLAMEVKKGVPGADEAFKFVFWKQRGAL